MKKLIKYISTSLLFILSISLITPAFAGSEDKKWYIGSGYSSMLAKVTTSNSAVPAGSDSSWQDKGGSTVVLTAHAIYYPTMGWGDERVRVFSRQTRAGMYLDPDGTGTYWTGSAAKTIRANVGFRAENYSTDSRLMINQTEPAESNSITTTIEQFFYELLGYKLYGFTGTIQSIVNGFQASTLKKTLMASLITIIFNIIISMD